ncbi:SMP-30/gluconolactonase/LRE family protein [Niveibacterium sp.]|uniref:SMP-30/gluconolactonase/LRE family protein n=1 Tax=Niveibacterium sp. TaxID=2017444 RepID=UPI0035B45F24
MKIECLVDARAGVGECPLWSPRDNCLWWIDSPGRRIHRYDPATARNDSFALPDEPGCIALAGHRLLVAMRHGVALFDPLSGDLEPVAGIDYDPATTRFNDGRCDRKGRFWVGSMFEPRTAPDAWLYRLDRGAVLRVVSGITVANGLAFAPDGRTLYRSDSPARTVFRHAYDPETGELGPAEIFQRFGPDEGRPDGAAVDRDGCYWIALYDGGAIMQIAPDGKRLRTIPVPVRCPTMVAFGGPALDRLYVTSASAGRSEAELSAHPLSGGLFSFDPGTNGLAEVDCRLD